MADIYSLKLHNGVWVKDANDSEYYVFRVPGGWLYSDKQYHVSTFVPYDNGFDPFFAAMRGAAPENMESASNSGGVDAVVAPPTSAGTEICADDIKELVGKCIRVNRSYLSAGECCEIDALIDDFIRRKLRPC